MTRQEQCGMYFKQINDELQKRANNSLRKSGVTMAQLGALLELYEAREKQLPLKDLEKRMHVAQSTAAGIICRLEQKGFVESFTDAADRRIKLVRITASGIDCCIRSEESMMEEEANIISSLTKEERQLLLTLLEKVKNSLT